MFRAMGPASEERLALFNLLCCRRIRELISDEATLQALDALENAPEHLTVPVGIALNAVRIVTTAPYDPSRNAAAAMAVAFAVCRSLPADHLRYCSDAVENARETALNCQWAVGWSADPATSGEDCEDEGAERELGHSWLRERAEKAEESAQCELFRQLFSRRVELAEV